MGQAFKDNVAPVLVQPAATAHMQQHLVLTLRKVVEQTRLGEAIGLKVVPHLIAQVALAKVNPALPYVFIEQGIAQLSSVLHSPVAIEVSVKIMRTNPSGLVLCSHF